MPSLLTPHRDSLDLPALDTQPACHTLKVRTSMLVRPPDPDNTAAATVPFLKP